ncbi:hypothetical protein TPA0908_15520 [Micromonospora sp. AKA38]|nr:hypothetical protein TPA0908_15520 [Micromonospora sp. AKA38]
MTVLRRGQEGDAHQISDPSGKRCQLVLKRAEKARQRKERLKCGPFSGVAQSLPGGGIDVNASCLSSVFG